jgi:hypothetical protein
MGNFDRTTNSMTRAKMTRRLGRKLANEVLDEDLYIPDDLVLREAGGGTDTVSITASAMTASGVYTIPDAGTTADFVMNAGAQSITGAKSFFNVVLNGPLTVSEDGAITYNCATGLNLLNIPANLASAYKITDGIGTVVDVDTRTGVRVLNLMGGVAADVVAALGRLSTTDGVASGTARVVGGRCTANVSAADSLLASAGAAAFVSFAQTYSIPADTLKVGSKIRIRALVRVSNASGADTLSCKLRVGTTTLITTTAVDPGATTDIHILEFELTARAAPGATASCIGSGTWITNTGGTIAHGTGLLGATNLATNGALVLDVQAVWSATTANTAAILETFDVEIL